ncbi:MAG TPA: O-antigen ligase family protein, partial [Gaiellales bacterium]|nr:O-antigen ligase family protein [Gaiellales bacterium]
WNALGILVAMASLVAIGFTANASTLSRRGLSAATLPILWTSLYFTFSRGAWAALALGLVAMFALSTHRWGICWALAATVPWVALDILIAATSPALVHVGSPVRTTAPPAHRLGLALIVSTLGIVCTLALSRRLETRWRPPEWPRRATVWALSGAVCLAVIGALVTVGSPATIAHRISNAFSDKASYRFEPTKQHAGQSLNVRLLSLSGNSRAELWRVAWDDVRGHPLLGSGAGSYAAYYLRYRSSGVAAVNANNLYLETLADLGPLGLVALLGGLIPPLVAAARGRGALYAPAAFGAYVAFLLHASVDWDWQMPAVTLSALMCGAVLLLVGHRDVPNWRPGRWARVIVVGGALVLAVGSLALLRGNLAISQSQQAASSYEWRSARTSAQTAVEWEPWSADAWMALGEAWVGLDRPGKAARAFRHAVRRDPGDWQTWYDLSIATSGREGRHALAEAYRLDPRGPEPPQVTY